MLRTAILFLGVCVILAAVFGVVGVVATFVGEVLLFEERRRKGKP